MLKFLRRVLAVWKAACNLSNVIEDSWEDRVVTDLEARQIVSVAQSVVRALKGK